MPYVLIGKRELAEKPKLGKKLSRLVRDYYIDISPDFASVSRGEKKGTSAMLDWIKADIQKYNLSYLLSLSEKGKPKGFIQCEFPAEKSGFVKTFQTFVARKFRGKSEATRLTYRLMAVSRNKGYAGINRGSLNKKMVRLSLKMGAHPRRILSKRDLPKLRSILRQKPAAHQQPEIIEVRSHKHNPKAGWLAGANRATIKFKQLKKPR